MPGSGKPYYKGMSAKKPIFVTFIGPLGIFRSSLRSYLSTLPGVCINRFSPEQDVDINEIGQQPSDIFLMDVDAFRPPAILTTALMQSIDRLHRTHPEALVVLLVNNLDQKQVVSACGAELVLLKGSMEESFNTFLATILNRPKEV